MRSWLGRAAFLGRAGWLGLGIALGVAAHSLPAWADGKTVEAASAAEKARAQAKFREASAHFRAARWDEAIHGFRESYEIVKSPNTYVMLGRALRKAGRLVEAYETLRQAAEDAHALASRIPKYNQAAKTAEVELAEIRTDLALVNVEVTPADGLVLSVAGRQIPDDRWKSIPVMPGKVEVVVKAPDGREARRVIDAVASREHPVTLELPEPAAPLAAPAPNPAARCAAPLVGERRIGRGAPPAQTLCVRRSRGGRGRPCHIRDRRIDGALHGARPGGQRARRTAARETWKTTSTRGVTSRPSPTSGSRSESSASGPPWRFSCPAALHQLPKMPAEGRNPAPDSSSPAAPARSSCEAHSDETGRLRVARRTRARSKLRDRFRSVRVYRPGWAGGLRGKRPRRRSQGRSFGFRRRRERRG